MIPLLALVLALPQEAAPQPPNIVIVLADDLGYGDPSAYGGWIPTPHLDRLAEGGVRFTDFHSSGNVCSPTRAGLQTGRYQQRAGIPGVINADPAHPSHQRGLQSCEHTLAEQLAARGYATALFGKWHLGYAKRFNPIHHGFSRFRGYVSGNIDYHSHYDRMGTYDWWEGLEPVREEGYATDLITKHALEFIAANRERPFFALIAHEAVHSPYQGPGDPPVRGPDATRGEKVEVKRAYREMMQAMDRSLGALRETLERLELERRTLVFFLSDNGANRKGSNGPLRGFKGSNWEGGHRVPAVAWWPGHIAPGQVCDTPAISLDLMPTALALAGVEAAAERPLDGVDLRPLLLEKGAPGERQLFWNGRAMRSGSWKLILTGKGAGTAQLYDLSTDIGERLDLSAKHPGRVARMRAALAAWTADVATGATSQPGDH